MRAGVLLRLYRPSDLEPLFELDRLCFERRFQFSLVAMRRFATASNAITLVAETQEKQIAGFVILHFKNYDRRLVGYLVTIDVSPAIVRTGVATRLLTEAERQASHQGAEIMRLHVHTENPGAIAFYLARGYRRVGFAADFYSPGADAEVFEKSISGQL